MPKHKCDNCRKIWDEVPEAKDLHERLDPDGEEPSGECPECGALCYPWPDNTNVLKGIGCVKCGNSDFFHIEVTARASFYDEGTHGPYHMEWNKKSFCRCDCGRKGTVADFTVD